MNSFIKYHKYGILHEQEPQNSENRFDRYR